MSMNKIKLKNSSYLREKINDIFRSLFIQRRANMTFLFFIFTPLACSGTHEENKNLSIKEQYQSIAVAKYQGNVQYLFNQNRSQVICFKFSKPTGLKPHPELDFFIYDLNKENILFEDSLMNARVSWINNSQVQVEFIPEIISEDENQAKSGYIYDVNMMQKLPIEPQE